MFSFCHRACILHSPLSAFSLSTSTRGASQDLRRRCSVSLNGVCQRRWPAGAVCSHRRIQGKASIRTPPPNLEAAAVKVHITRGTPAALCYRQCSDSSTFSREMHPFITNSPIFAQSRCVRSPNEVRTSKSHSPFLCSDVTMLYKSRYHVHAKHSYSNNDEGALASCSSFSSIYESALYQL